MLRYYDKNHKALKAGDTSAISLDCGEDKQLWNDSANPHNLVWDGDTPRFKTEAEHVAELIPQKIRAIELAADTYIENRGYRSGYRFKALDKKEKANNAQKALIDSVSDWIDNIVNDKTNGMFARIDEAMAATTLAELAAVSEDFSNFDASDPEITLYQIEKAK